MTQIIDRQHYEMLPVHCRKGMQRYFEDHVRPGRFLLAVLSNQLVAAFVHADLINISSMVAYATFLYLHAPVGSWGSRDAVEAWLTPGEDK